MSMIARFEETILEIRNRELEVCSPDDNQFGLDVRGKVLSKSEIEALNMAYALNNDEVVSMTEKIKSLGKLYSYSWQDAHVYHVLDFTIEIAKSKRFLDEDRNTLF